MRYHILMKRAGLILLSIFFLQVHSFLLSASDDELRLEGVAYESASPKESIAVINGNFLKTGDEIAGYRVIQVSENSVRLSKLADSSERELQITGKEPTKPKVIPALKEVIKPKPPEPVLPPQPKKKEGVISKWFSNSFSVLELARQTSVLGDLRQIHTAASAFASEHEGMEGANELTVDKLAEAGLISAAYRGGVKGGYRFAIQSNPGSGGAAVSADPVDSKPGLKHFFVDGHGVIFFEEDKPATDQSKPFQI